MNKIVSFLSLYALLFIPTVSFSAPDVNTTHLMTTPVSVHNFIVYEMNKFVKEIEDDFFIYKDKYLDIYNNSEQSLFFTYDIEKDMYILEIYIDRINGSKLKNEDLINLANDITVTNQLSRNFVRIKGELNNLLRLFNITPSVSQSLRSKLNIFFRIHFSESDRHNIDCIKNFKDEKLFCSEY